MPRFRGVDLNLLLILESLYRHLNVSSAAAELGMTQSAVSHALAKLRQHYDDPLFVRVSRGVAPTEFARSIHPDVENFVAHAQSLTQKTQAFDPAKVTDTIVILSTDFFELVAAPKLLARLKKEAPGVRLTFRPLIGGIPKDALESGDCDLAAAGYFEDVPAGYYRQKLFSDHYAVAHRKNHPRAGKTLTVDTYYECEHARLTVWRDGKDPFSRTINGRRMVRNLKYTSGTFSTLMLAVSGSDLLLTAPSTVIDVYRDRLPLTVQSCPVPAKIEMDMVWHGITHRNPLRQWFRQLVREVTAGISPRS